MEYNLMLLFQISYPWIYLAFASTSVLRLTLWETLYVTLYRGLQEQTQIVKTLRLRCKNN